MFQSITNFFNSDEFMPHGHCFLWEPQILWLHILSDAGIALAYYSIPLALLYFTSKRKDLPFPGIFWLFSAFITLCGTTHLLSIWVIWHPDYALEGVVKAITAMVSIATFFVTIRLIPKALQLPSHSQLAVLNRQLEEANEQLEALYATTQESTQATRALLASIVESSDDPIISRSLDGRIMSWNKGAEHLFGYTADEVIGQSIDVIIPPDRKHEEEEIFARLKAENKIEHLETIRVAKDGHKIEVAITASPIRDANNEIIGVSKVVHDITTTKQTEERLKSTLVEVTVAKRIADEEKNKAQQASDAKSEFLANMSHEIRTPLNTIIGTSELLTYSALDSKQRKYVEMLTAAGNMLLSLLNNILDFSKIESGSVEIVQKPVCIKSLFDEIEQVITGQIQANGLTLSMTCPDSVPEALIGDAVRLKQVLLNLANNAVKFCNHGTIGIHAGLLRHAGDQVWVRFGVKDTGPGIPADKQAVIFEKFTQLGEFTTKKYSGTGLGLAICKGLVEKMGGRIGVESEPGKGSLFWFELPFATAAMQPDAPEYAAAQKGAQPLPSGKEEIPVAQFHGRVLLVEDYAPNRQMAKAMLEKLGCDVEVAQNGEEALEQLEQSSYDIVFMDCQMPEMDGFQTTSEIRKRENNHNTVIVAMTAHVLSGDRERCIRAGMNDYVSKPIRSAELSRVLQRYLAA